jgi:hypothetical protein
MASVGDSTRKAIDDWAAGDTQFAMMHACNAIDGTAKKLHPEAGSNARFTRLLRDNYFILGPMGSPGIDLVNTRWPVTVQNPKASGGQPDLADVIYGVHRCTHSHGEALPDGFELHPDAAGPTRMTHFSVRAGKVQLSDRIIFGLLAVAVLSPANADQRVPDGYHLKFANTTLMINEWWGRASDIPAVLATEVLPLVKLNFGNWMGPAR